MTVRALYYMYTGRVRREGMVVGIVNCHAAQVKHKGL